MKHINFILLLTTIFAGGCMKQSTDYNSEWYSGGTLHESLISEWKVATYENKLATCADFVATINPNLNSMETLKMQSKDLMNCIDEAVLGNHLSDDKQVSIIAAQCTVLLGN